MNEQPASSEAADVPKRSYFGRSARSLSLFLVAATALGSLFLVERTDTPTTASDPGVSTAAQDSLAISHRNRPHRPTTVEGAVEAAHFAGLEVQAAIDRVNRRPDRGFVPERCEVLLNARATFVVRIEILIDLVPDAEDRLLRIEARVLARIDAALRDLDCPISG